MLATTMRYRGNRFLVIAHHSLTKLVKWHMAARLESEPHQLHQIDQGTGCRLFSASGQG